MRQVSSSCYLSLDDAAQFSHFGDYNNVILFWPATNRTGTMHFTPYKLILREQFLTLECYP